MKIGEEMFSYSMHLQTFTKIIDAIYDLEMTISFWETWIQIIGETLMIVILTNIVTIQLTVVMERMEKKDVTIECQIKPIIYHAVLLQTVCLVMWYR